MPNYHKYGDFFDKYDPERTAQELYQNEPRSKSTKYEKKKKRKQSRYLRLLAFLLPYIIAAVAVVLCITLIVYAILRPKDSEGSYTALTVSTLSSEAESTDVTPPSLFKPTLTDSTVSLGSKIESEYGILVERSSGNILAKKSHDTKIYPASMTKIMTLLVAAENVIDLNATFTMTSAIIDPLYRKGSVMAGFKPKEEVRIEDLFYGSILTSGGEATMALAIHIAGSEEEFVKMMNQKAADLGLTNTHFCNTIGLHDKNHYSTCTEMAIIMDAVLNNEFCRKVISTEYYTVAANEYHEELTFHSGMFTKMRGNEPEVATVKGGKTGYTANAANCLVSYAQTDDGREIICVTAKGGGKYVPIYDCIKLYKDYTY